LAAALGAPLTARGPWLTAVLNDQAVHRRRGRPVAVVVETHPQGRPEGLALLSLRRRGLRTVVTMLGDDVPLPGGRPPARLPASDDDVAARLAAGILDLLGSLRGPWALELSGLPLGDPVARSLAAGLPTATLGNVRTLRLVDELDQGAERSRDPRVLDRWLPALLAREPDRRARTFLRSAARLHAAIDRLEVALVADGDRLHAGLLTLVDGDDRWPWWGTGEAGGPATARGFPAVSLTATGPERRRRSVSGGTAAR
jgi:hypothetical protein